MIWSSNWPKLGLYLLIILGIIAIIYFNFADILNDTQELAVVSKRAVGYNNVLYQQVRTTAINRWNLTNPKIFNDSILVILVITVPDEVQVRQDIRATWANLSTSEENKVSVIFLTGKAGSISSIRDENEKNGDILLMNVKDTYRNLVYKEFLAYRWLNENFRPLSVAKVDSDVVLNADRLLKLFDGKGKNDFWIQCSTLKWIPPRRDPTSKWYVPRDALPNMYYPSYCNGPMYVMSAGVIGKLLASAEDTKIFEVEDAFFTGVLREKSGVALIENRNIYKDQPNFQPCSNGTGTIIGYPIHGRRKTIGLRRAFDEFKKIKCK